MNTAPLTPHELETYRQHCAAAKHANRCVMTAGVEDIERMIAEIDSSRLAVEKLAEKIAELRESFD